MGSEESKQNNSQNTRPGRGETVVDGEACGIEAGFKMGGISTSIYAGGKELIRKECTDEVKSLIGSR